jgi:eukaryotic-like serine/threonine-protein kinase
MSFAEGFVLGPYRIVEVVGRGGTATVYRAYHDALSRHVAIKVLTVSPAEDESSRERFRTEAVTVANLRHPNILQVFDIGEDCGVRYLVMEFVEGTTLAARLGYPWPSAEVVRTLAPIADALDYAHARGILHRDVKPSNVLLAGDGTPILADFGLARTATALVGLTRTGALVGTPEYMAPEQAAGHNAAAATDRYALAIVAYEMVFGRVPFRSETPVATLLAHLQRPLPFREEGVQISRSLMSVLRKALAKNPGHRYATATDFVDALRATLTDGSAAPPIPTTEMAAPHVSTREEERPAPWALLILAGSIVLAGVVAFWPALRP